MKSPEERPPSSTLRDGLVELLNRAAFRPQQSRARRQLLRSGSRCTHQGCPVNKWTVTEGIVCPCHGSTYQIDGTLIYGAAGPNQPPLARYNFNYDGGDLLQIEVPGLNLKINSIAAETITPTNKRLRLSFPVKLGCDYRVRYSPDLSTPAEPVLFARTAGGLANRSTIRATTTAPLNVWVDNAGPRGFYSIELVLIEIL